MDSNEIARKFFEQGQGNKWLTKGQTSWLYTQACRDANNRRLTSHGTPAAGGLFTLESGEAIGWDIAVSPINGCAVLQTRSVTAIMEKQEAERVALLEGGRLFVQTVKRGGFADQYPPDLVARMYRVSVEQANEWFAEASEEKE